LLTRVVLVLLPATLISSPIKARATAPTRDPQALTLIASSVRPLTGSVTVNDVTVQATASYVAGSDKETGTATLAASANQQSLVQLNLSGGSRQEIRNGPVGAWIGTDGTAHSMAIHNCWTDGSWFFRLTTIHVRCSPSALINLEQSPIWR